MHELDTDDMALDLIETRREDDDLSATFRAAMRGVASTVAILTTRDAGRRWGLTATAFSSFSVEPPTLIVCVNRSAEAYEPIVQSRCICVNVLAETHRDLATRFAGRLGHKGEERFGSGDWHQLRTGAPVLREAALAFDCRAVNIWDYATHSVLVCRVFDVAMRPSAGAPLVYLDGDYVSVARR